MPRPEGNANEKGLNGNIAGSVADFNEKNDKEPSPAAVHSSPAASSHSSEPQIADGAVPAEQEAEQQPEAAAAAPTYPKGMKLAVIVIGLQLSVLCVALDNTIIATAIPKITDEFHALSDVGWYGSAYLLTLSAFQLFFGRLYSIFNIKYTFLVALFLFELGSLICGVAPTSVALIVGRAIAGLGSAGLFSGSLIILAFVTPLEKRPVFNSLLTSVYGVASVVGPLIGGLFADHVTWRWCFYVNLPIGGATAVALIFFLGSLPAQAVTGDKTWLENVLRFDPLGTLLFTPCIVCVLLALQWGGTTYPWSSGRIIALFVVFGVLLIAFVAAQFWAGDNATVPIRIARQRTIASGGLFSLCVGAAFFIMIYYIPIWFQAIHLVSATRSGIYTLPMMIADIAAVLIAGALVARWGWYTPFMYGLVVFGSTGAGLLTTWTVDVSTGKWIGYQILFGAGIGMGMQQTLLAAQAVLPLADVPTGTAMMQFCQMFGGSLFVSVAQNAFTTHLVSGLAGIPGVDPTAVVNAGATQILGLFSDPNVLHTVQIVYNDALMKAFQIALIMNCLAALGAAGIGWKNFKTAHSEQNAPEQTSEERPEEKSDTPAAQTA